MFDFDQLWRRIRQEITGEGKPPLSDDPEALLNAAQTEMREMHARNRQRAVKAITQKNNLQHMVDDTVQKVNELHIRAETARSQGHHELAEKLFFEKGRFEETLHLTQDQLAQAIETVEQVKTAIRHEEAKIRQKTAEALALKAQWKLVQMEQALTRSLAEASAGRAGDISREEGTARHTRNREFAMEAITYKNNVQLMVDDTERKIDNLREKADLARRRGDDEMEHALLREMEQYEATLAHTRVSLERALRIADHARALMQEEDTRLRNATEPAEREAERAESPPSDDWIFAAWLVLLAFAFLVSVLVLWWLTRPH